jgi:hypothetical protein
VLFGRKGGDDEGAEERDESTFGSRWGWVYNTKQIADFENISMDEAYQLPVMQCLNDLSYLKDYEENQKRLLNARDSEQ